MYGISNIFNADVQITQEMISNKLKKKKTGYCR